MWKEKVLTLKVALPSAGVLIAASSLTAGYFLGAKRAKVTLEKHFEEELEVSKNYYQNLYDNRTATLVKKPEDLETLAEKYEDLVEGQQYLPVGEVTKITDTDEGIVVEGRIHQNIFRERMAEMEESSDVTEDWNWDLENHVREMNGGNVPYVIHREEWEENPAEFEQTSFTYYKGDDVLADDKDEPVEDVEGVVKETNLSRFGEGSDDPNVVYIRNDRLSLDIEVNLSRGRYDVEVLGADELEHSDYSNRLRKHNRVPRNSGPRKFRRDD